MAIPVLQNHRDRTPEKRLIPRTDVYPNIERVASWKWTDSSAADEDLEALLRDCDLGKKMQMLLRFWEDRRGSCSWLLGFTGDLRVGFSRFQCGMWVLTFFGDVQLCWLMNVPLESTH